MYNNWYLYPAFGYTRKRAKSKIKNKPTHLLLQSYPKLRQCFIFGLLRASFFTCKTTEH